VSSTKKKNLLLFWACRSHAVTICLPLHVHNCVENVPKYILFYVHDIKVMAEEIDLPIRKLLENTSVYPIVG
jgi:hypothetical protein